MKFKVKYFQNIKSEIPGEFCAEIIIEAASRNEALKRANEIADGINLNATVEEGNENE